MTMHVVRGHMIVPKGLGWNDYACGKAPLRISNYTLSKRMPSVPSRVTCKLCLRTKAFRQKTAKENS